MGVRPTLLVEGIHIILGNGLVGERVWANNPVLPIIVFDNKAKTEFHS